MNIFLCGYMGVGKSSVGKQLSEALNRPFIDLDKIIEYQCRISISEIFDDKGEAYFRHKETEALSGALANKDHAVIALGGGTVIKDENQSLIKGKGRLIYLEASPEYLLNRIKNDSSKRPLLEKYESDDDLLTFIRSHLNDRLQFYQKADITINTEKRTPADIVAELKSNIK